MLFLPIDKKFVMMNNNSNNSSNLQKKRRSIMKANLMRVKSTVQRNQNNAPLSQLEATASFKSNTMKQKSEQFSTFETIKQGSQDAQQLIKFIRKVQYENNGTQPAAQDASAYGMDTSFSPRRVLTTMSPSTKERLRKNLHTFSSQRRISAQQIKEKHMLLNQYTGNMKLYLPNYTKNAYTQNERAGSRIKSNCSQSKSQTMPAQFQGTVTSYDNEINDETLLFKYNAAKPLVNSTRSFKIQPKVSNRQQNFQLQTENDQVLTRTNQNRLPMKMRASSALSIKDRSIDLTFADRVQKSPSRHKYQNNLFAKQRTQSTLLAAGKSRHFNSHKNSHEDCKLIYQNSKEELLERPQSSKVVAEQKFCQASPYGHYESLKLTADDSNASFAAEQPFTVKLCVKCKRSVKFKDHTHMFKSKRNSLEKEEIPEVQEQQPLQMTTACTQVDCELGSRYRNQRYTQTQDNPAADAYTQIDRLTLVDCATKMSSDRFTKVFEDQQVQTIEVDLKAKRRPHTSMQNRKRKQTAKSKKTYNYIASAVNQPEDLNGRRFVIYSKDEYQSFVQSKSKALLDSSNTGSYLGNPSPISNCYK